MRFGFVVALVLAGVADADRGAGRFDRFNSRCVGGRTDRGLPCADYAFFELAPATSAGMTAACACAAITGAKGEAVANTRAGNATCQKSGISSTVADGDFVVCGANVPRVEAQSDGVLGIRSESAATNTCLQSAQLCDVVYSDVGTPNCAINQATGPFGTLTMDQFTDNDALAREGRSQAIVTTSATTHTISCGVKGGTATSAFISLVGTGSSTGDCSATLSGLSTTSTRRITCTSPAAYAGTLTGVTLTIAVGAAVGDQGTLFVEGCDHVVNSTFMSSEIPTTTVGVTRNADAVFATVVDLSSTTICAAATVEPLWVTASAPAAATAVEPAWSGVFTVLQANGGGSLPTWLASVSRTGTFTAGLQRIIGRDDNTTVTIVYGSNTATVAAGAAGDRFTGSYGIGAGLSGSPLNGIISRVQVDPSASRCN